MKSSKEFAFLRESMQKVAAEASILYNNNTQGTELIVIPWDQEESPSPKMVDLERRKATMLLQGRSSEIPNLVAMEMAKMTEEDKAIKRTFVLKLVEKIPYLEGTSVYLAGDKVNKPFMENVEYIYLQENIAMLDAFTWTETGQKALDKYGKEVDEMKLVLTNSIIDIKKGKVNAYGKEVLASRAYIYTVSARAMQIAGKIMNTEARRRESLYATREIN